MPEKVHKKFHDGEAKPPTPSTASIKNSLSKALKQEVKAALHGDGVKRFRDGSPKYAANAKPYQPPEAASTSQTKKQRTNSQSNGSSNVVLQTNGKVRLSKESICAEYQKEKGAPIGRKQKSDGRNKLTKTNTQQNLLEAAKELEKLRVQLPIWSKKGEIRYALRIRDVLLLHGETGSGKSTQIPQFLYDQPWCKKRTVEITTGGGRQEQVSVGGVIAVTEPRRVAAITLAKRVAKEMGSYLGKEKHPGSVGYSVRFDSITPPGMKIKFVTEGMLLQEMLRDPHLRQYSAVIVDEIHERSVDVDLIVGFLRQLLHGDKKGRGGVPLKVVIMSATMDLGGLETFFAKPGTHSYYKPGKKHGKDLLETHDCLTEESTDEVKGGPDLGIAGDQSRRPSSSSSSWEGINSSNDSESDKEKAQPDAIGFRINDVARRTLSTHDTNESQPGLFYEEGGVAVEHIEGRQYDVTVRYETKPSSDYLHDVLQTILRIHVSEPLPGDILAFLTGQEEIEILQTQLEHHASNLAYDVPRMKILPLYGSLSAQAQQDVFEKVKEPRTRKVVLATNIAETSVTVSGVRFVVDCGKSKVKQYRPRLGMESLLAKPISKVSAIQRAGRAGREGPGKCYRIYTAEDFSKLEADELPEILRSDVVEAVLKMKARGVDDVLSFPLMDSPNIVAMEKALLQLHSMDAIDSQGKLTNTGKFMAAYPLPAAYSRVIIAAAESGCLLEAIDVIACLTTDSEVFYQAKSDEEQENIEEHRKDLQHRHGDILTYLNTMQKYAAETTDRIEWCKKRLVSVRAMKLALAIRKQLRQICHKQKLLSELPAPDPQPANIASEEQAEVLLKTFLKAFSTKTAVLGPDGAYYTVFGRNLIAIHPSSVMFGKKIEAIMFLDHVFTAKSYAKKVSAIQANWIVGALDL